MIHKSSFNDILTIYTQIRPDFLMQKFLESAQMC